MSSASACSRSARVDLINSESFQIMPYSYCCSHHLQCMMKPGNDVCEEYTRQDRPCDGKGISLTEADCLVQAKKRIEAAEEATEEELLDLQRRLNERLSRLIRLRRQKRHIETRRQEMLEKGFQSIDELEESERQESEAVVDARSAGAAYVIDWSTILDSVALKSRW
ncbi:hypothetical protein FOXG_18863 [Fusarium oxysporum f. sp. lycopersici 4287]|uniref:Uncharacterized protein n=2 Tax=Fusarium oxysporum TaxID=5507 RepID=A0A0J9UPZ0_FUSO4|nr:hypothetical protein FOXG_18863 [Fusarium oxysporum f. sp. lycopersici 4287]EXK43533.1 hypothetical protein FOMG_02478 [Fusarium oxysporum f. sp. melonis 26406]KNB01360.1 hypothetical protein FOXG_18863 [Fusarium oxysporum f. sp. lycopersici 4287]